MQAALPFGSDDPADPMVLTVSLAYRDVVWRLWKVPRRGPLGFWSKALPSAIDNYSSFEKELLACY